MKNKDAKDTIKHETQTGMHRRQDQHLSFQFEKQEQYRRMLNEKKFQESEKRATSSSMMNSVSEGFKMRIHENRERAEDCRQRIKDLSLLEDELTEKLKTTFEAQQTMYNSLEKLVKQKNNVK